MPLKKGSSKKTISKNISEFHKGKTFEKTKQKFGKKRANAQAVSVAMKEAGKSRKPMKSPGSSSEKEMESYAKNRKK